MKKVIAAPVQFNDAKMPEFIKMSKSCVHWQANQHKPGGRFNKVPVNTAGITVNAHDSSNWLSYADVVRTFNPRFHSGIAIDLTGKSFVPPGYSDPLFLIGVDIDECVEHYSPHSAPILHPDAQAVVQLCNSYWEISPSGTGVRIFFYYKEKIAGKNEKPYEIYSSGRFLTVTGEGQGKIREISDMEMNALNKHMFGAPHGKQKRASNFGANYFSDGKSPPPEDPACITALDQALAMIPPAIERATWVKVLLAIKAHGFSCGEKKARDWSQSAGPYDKQQNPCGYEESAFDAVWRCEVQEISARTLYYIARQFSSVESKHVFGDTRNGRKFAELFRGKLMFVYAAGRWLEWQTTRWRWCDESVALQAAKETAERLLDDANAAFKLEPASQDARRAVAQAQDAFNLKKLQAMITCAASEPGMHIGELSALDADPMLLGCVNGVLDLRTGKLVTAAPKQLITKSVGTRFTNSAKCPRWRSFIDDITLHDPHLADYLQRMCGYLLTGIVSEEVLHFLYGVGRNGKSVFANVLTRIWGEYALTAQPELLMRKDRQGVGNEVARLVGVRLLMANETRNGQAFDDLMLKTLVSTERISARFLYKEFFDFWPTHKILIRGNHKPLITDETEGAWRRIRLIPFELQLEAKDADAGLEAALVQEVEGILRWAVDGCLRWQAEGLKPTAKIEAASAGYRSECDLLGDFLEEYTLDPQAQIPQQQLWNNWRSWCENNGIREGSKKSFTRRLLNRGIVQGWKGSLRQYNGIRRAATTN